jgi:hypothetical protein
MAKTEQPRQNPARKGSPSHAGKSKAGPSGKSAVPQRDTSSAPQPSREHSARRRVKG